MDVTINQDSLKEILEKYTDHKDFTVIFSGKTSKSIAGLYKPESKEIIIHNKNFISKEGVLYTGLHELAHHILFTTDKEYSTQKAHNLKFWALFDSLVAKAIESKDLETITGEWLGALRNFNTEHGNSLKRLGKSMINAMDECQKAGYPFEDICRRILHLSRSEAIGIMKTYTMDIKPEVGAPFAVKIAAIKDPEEREEAEKTGVVPLKGTSSKDLDEYASLAQEKARLERSIEKLSNRLEEVELALEGKE